MAVTVAPNVQENANDEEMKRLRQFASAPVDGGKIKVKISGQKDVVEINHTTYGRGQTTASVFFTRTGQDYAVFGVGVHDGTVGGKTKYSALWNGRGARRVSVVIQ